MTTLLFYACFALIIFAMITGKRSYSIAAALCGGIWLLLVIASVILTVVSFVIMLLAVAIILFLCYSSIKNYIQK